MEYQSIVETIGNTPVVRINRLAPTGLAVNKRRLNPEKSWVFEQAFPVSGAFPVDPIRQSLRSLRGSALQGGRLLR
jgi:hypothetical protein